MNKEKWSLIYDECEIVEDEIKYILENKEDFDYIEDFSEDSLRNYVYDNCDLFNNRWSDLKEINKNDVFKIKGSQMGWKNLGGVKTMRAVNGKELLEGILPNTSEFTLWVEKTKTQIIIKCSHHDSPMGEYYCVKAVNKKELREFEEDE